MNENPFNDYCEADNYYEEDSNSDLESRLYANIHYAPVEIETPNEPSDMSKIFLKDTDNINDTNVLNNNERHEVSAFECTDNVKNAGHNSCQSMQLNNDVTHNELDEAVNTDSTTKVYNISKDPYLFDTNIEDQRVILPIKKKRHRNKSSQEQIKQSLLNFVFKVPNTSQTLSNNRGQIRGSFVNSNNVKNLAASNINPKKKQIESRPNKQDAEHVFTKYQNSKQSVNKTYVEKQKEVEEISTKYCVIEKKEKVKLQGIEHNNNAKEGDSDSDSDLSILEVPISPKPQPPLINLNDSDEETVGPNGDGVTKKSLGIENCNMIEFKNQIKRALAKSKSELLSVSDSENLDDKTATEDIVLNCTEIEKGASSISEIREMRKGVQIKKKFHNTEETGSNVLQESVKIDNDKNKFKKGNADVNNKSLDDKDTNYLHRVTNKEKDKSTYLGEGAENNESKINLANKNVNCPVDEFPADAYIRSQNKLNANKKRQRECQQQINDNVKRIKNNSEASTINLHSKTHKNKDKSIDKSNSHVQKDFDINETRSKMSKDPRLWAILDEDLRPKSKKQRFWDIKCTRCQQHGHQRSKCPEPHTPPKCHMCGVQGHTEVRCPQKMCLTCGKRQGTFKKTCESCRTFYCTMCNAVGHKCTECPDLWRRYHQTTTTDDVTIPSNTLGVMKPADRLFCCNCTKRGHDSATCKDYRWSQHFPTPAFVSNYTDGPTYIEKQSQNVNAQCLSDANIVQFENGANNGKGKNDVTTVKSTDNILPFPKELIKKTQSKKKAFPQNLPQLTWENEHNIAYIIYQCGEFYTIEDDGMEIKYAITARKGFNTYRIMECRVVPSFLEKLLNLFRFEVKIYREVGMANEIVLRIRTFADLINDLRRFILYWLSLEDDEKDYVIYLNLPLQRIAMIDVLNAQIRKLGTEMGNPTKLYNTINTLKTGLASTRSQQKYENMLDQLEETQFKLLMILNDHPNLRIVAEEMRKLIRTLERSNSEDVPLQQYLQILTVYNFLFVPHTPPKSFITQYGKKSNPAVVLNFPHKFKSSNIVPTIENQPQYNSMSSNNLKTCKRIETNSVQESYQNMSNVTGTKYIPPPGIAELPHCHNNINQNNISESNKPSGCNDPLPTNMGQNKEPSDDFILNRDIIRYDTISKSHDFLPIDTSSEKYTNITVDVSNKDQSNTAHSLKSNMEDCRNNENQSVNKYTNITLNVSNKNRNNTATNFKSNVDDSENDKCQNANKHTSIIVNVSNKNQARTNTSFQSNENNTKNNNYENGNKYTNITVSVSDKNSTRTVVNTASNSNNSKNYNLQSSEVDNSNKKVYSNTGDVVSVEINKKQPNCAQKQQTNKQRKAKNKNKKKALENPKIKKNKPDLTTRQLQIAQNKCDKLRLLAAGIKEELRICSSNNQEEWRQFGYKIKKLVGPCEVLHLKRASRDLILKIRQKKQTLQDIHLLNKLVSVEHQHQEEMVKLYKSYSKQSNEMYDEGIGKQA